MTSFRPILPKLEIDSVEVRFRSERRSRFMSPERIRFEAGKFGSISSEKSEKTRENGLAGDLYIVPTVRDSPAMLILMKTDSKVAECIERFFNRVGLKSSTQ